MFAPSDCCQSTSSHISIPTILLCGNFIIFAFRDWNIIPFSLSPGKVICILSDGKFTNNPDVIVINGLLIHLTSPKANRKHNLGLRAKIQYPSPVNEE